MQIQNENVTCVVVTYNRIDLLLECLRAILAQTLPVNRLIIVDNASTDGTGERLRNEGFLDMEQIEYVLMESNTGGAGGFSTGIDIAKNIDADWIWIMDDDTIPTKTCLEELIKAKQIITKRHANTTISFLASAVYGENGEFMNVPAINMKSAENGYAYWYEHLDQGIVSISKATFVSILLNSEAVKKCGLPNPMYYIWGDDSEYTMRLSRYYGDAFLVGNSVAVHKRKNAKAMSIYDEPDPNRINMYHYLFRNHMINGMLYDGNKYFFRCIKEIIKSPTSLRKKNGLKIMQARIKGNVEAIIEYPSFKKYLDTQLAEGR